MRFILLLAALVGCIEIYAQSFSDPKYMNQETQQPRTQMVVGDRGDATIDNSKFMAAITEWTQSGEEGRTFESKFTRPFSWIGRQFYLRVGSATSPYSVMVNGKEVGKVLNCSSPAEFNITRVVKEGRNIVTLSLDEGSLVAEIEGWRGAGVSKPSVSEVCVVSQPTQMIRDLMIETSTMGEKLNSQISIIIKSHALAERTSTLHYSLHRPSGDLVTFGKRNITQSMRGEDTISFSTITPLSEGWSGDNPQLLTLRLSIQHEGRYLEYQNYDIGFRAVELDPTMGEITINGKAVKLIAKRLDNPESVDFEALKANGFNAIKITAGTPSLEQLYSACDKEGIYVITTAAINSSAASQQITAGGNPTNSPEWWGAYMQRIDANYHTSQLHPSVVAFAVADNSLNGYNLYEGYLRLKGKETTRPVLYFESAGEWNSDKLDVILK